MAILTIESVDYEVDRVSRGYDSLVSITEMDDGSLTSSRGVSAATAARVWGFTTGILTKAEAEDLRATLLAPGSVSAEGDAIALGGGAIDCLARNVGRAIRLLEDWWIVSFELVEVMP